MGFESEQRSGVELIMPRLDHQATVGKAGTRATTRVVRS